MGVVKAVVVVVVVVVVGNPELKIRERVKSLLEDIYIQRDPLVLSLSCFCLSR